jgi:hypothetical protein
MPWSTIEMFLSFLYSIITNPLESLSKATYLFVDLAIQILILQDQDQKFAANSFLLVFAYHPPTRTDLR